MNVYVKAALDTVAFFLFVIAVAVGTRFVLDNAGDYGSWIIAAVAVSMAAYIIYGISLARRKYQSSLKQ